MSDYDRMRSLDGGGSARAWVSQAGVLAKFDRVLVEPLEFWLADSSYGGVREDDLARLSVGFFEALQGALNGRYAIVDEPATGSCDFASR